MSDLTVESAEIKVLVVDDSLFFRTSIATIIGQMPGIRIVDSAHNGVAALKKLDSARPDVILLDFFMPKMGGIETLQEIMKRGPTPTIIITAADKSEYADMYFEALRLGAFDIIAKPSGGDSLRFELIGEILENRIRYAARTQPRAIAGGRVPEQKWKAAVRRKSQITRHLSRGDGSLVIIGASAGGPRAIFEVLAKVALRRNASICIIQHMPEFFTKKLAARIGTYSDYNVKEAGSGDELRAGWIYVAPGDRHMELKEVDGRISIEINQNDRVHGCRPSIDVFMKSALRVLGAEQLVGVILTGMGDDGAAGLLLVREGGGSTIVQDKNTSEIWGMPRKAVELGAGQHVLPLDAISGKINSLLMKT